MTHPLQKPFTSKLIEELGRELDIAIELESNFHQAGRIQLIDGSYSYFKLSTLDCNRSGSAKIATDKDYASYFLEKLGYPVPQGRAFFSDAWCLINKTHNNKQAALRYAAELGLPVIAKPNSKAQGNGVVKIRTIEALAAALDKLFLIDDIVLIQKVIAGKDYRLIVYRESVPIIYERRPLAVIGDGLKSLKNLLEFKLQRLAASGRHIGLSLQDERILSRLASERRSLESVPEAGEYVQLLDNANMSSGAEAVDVSSLAHDSYKTLAVRLVREMGLAFCGLDLMTEEEISQPIGKYTILEINDHPGLEHYAMLNETARERVKQLYRRILSDLQSDVV